MREEYDFSNARKNPYAAQLEKQITIRRDEDSIDSEMGVKPSNDDRGSGFIEPAHGGAGRSAASSARRRCR
jgi:hypothetical protein